MTGEFRSVDLVGYDAITHHPATNRRDVCS
jgi:hypothetical protein